MVNFTANHRIFVPPISGVMMAFLGDVMSGPALLILPEVMEGGALLGMDQDFPPLVNRGLGTLI